jgi:RimJ/RimL family protein N-acetyltransferase
VNVSIRRATADDVDFLLELANDEDVEPFMGARAARTREALAQEVERSEREPDAFGRFVIEVDGTRAGMLGFHQVSDANRIAHLEKFAVHRDFRGVGVEAARMFCRHLFSELGYHRLELEIYGFNERALRHAERVGYVREGVRRKAYLRHGEWQDGVLYGLVREDVES